MWHYVLENLVSENWYNSSELSRKLDNEGKYQEKKYTHNDARI